MQRTWSVTPQTSNQPNMPMVLYPLQLAQPPVALASPADPVLWTVLLLLMLLLVPLGALALILFFLWTAVRASYALRVLVALTGLATFVHLVLIPFLINL